MAFSATAFALLISSGPLLAQPLFESIAITTITVSSQKPPRLLQRPVVAPSYPALHLLSPGMDVP